MKQPKDACLDDITGQMKPLDRSSAKIELLAPNGQ